MSRLIKSLFDKTMAAIALLLFSPLIVVIAIRIYFNMGSPIIFAQSRPGKDGKVFTLYKFRTMIPDARESDCDNPAFTGTHLPDAHRINPFGKLLRKTSLDELPQLWNFLKDDMSFVGPRPFFLFLKTKLADY